MHHKHTTRNTGSTKQPLNGCSCAFNEGLNKLPTRLGQHPKFNITVMKNILRAAGRKFVVLSCVVITC